MSLLAAAVSAIMSCIASLGATDAASHKLKLRPKQYDVRVERRVELTTKDGIHLAADIFHPRGLAKTPTILVRAPISPSPNICFLVEVVGRIWAERGYTAVIQGTRGRYNSGGDFYPMVFERRDGIETLRWLKQRPWFNGQLLEWGGSAFGQTEWAISDQLNPKPAAMEIYFASSKFHDMFYQGDAFALYSAVGWTLRSHDKKVDESKFPETKRILRATNTLPMRDADKHDLGYSVSFFQDWVNHKKPDEYWLEVDGQNRAAAIDCPVLFVAGWYDPFLQTEINDFQQTLQNGSGKAKKSRLVIGPWAHGRDVVLPGFTESQKFREASIALSIPWFDAALHDTDCGAPVTLFTQGTNKWRTENEWPLKRTRFTNLYLSSEKSANGLSGGGNLSSKPVVESRCDHFDYDPMRPVPTVGGAMIGDAAGTYLQKPCEGRADVLTYTSAAMFEDTEITGPVKAVLYVSTNVSCTDFTCKLVDVYPDGRAYNLCDGIVRRKYPQQTAGAGSGSVHEIEIDLTATSNVFLKGHRIRLDVSSSNFPRFDRNPNTSGDAAKETHPVIAHQNVYSGGKYRSKLILPVIPEKQ